MRSQSYSDGNSLRTHARKKAVLFKVKLIRQVKDKLGDIAASNYYKKYGYVRPKYLRKFAFDKMIELEVPESVADFIEGRAPERIGAKHYLALARQSAKFHPRYQAYLKKLKAQA